VIRTMLTTVDNPFSPFDDYPAWLAYDLALGYDTSGFLGRIATVSDDLSESDQEAALEAAIDEIVKENATGTYRKVTKNF
jgi:hypothetical protein